MAKTPPKKELLSEDASGAWEHKRRDIEKKLAERLALLTEQEKADFPAFLEAVAQQVNQHAEDAAPGRSLRRMRDWNDLLPTAGMRKQNKKMLADQQAHIEDLVKVGSWRAARWQVVCTWLIWVWYVLKRPVSSLSRSLQGKIGG